MSVIEQAAKRLEELRRSGVDLGETTSLAAPTPEAAVLALQQRNEPTRRELHQSTDTEQKESRSRQIELDFEHLRTLGFLTPDAGNSQLAEEFRIIKRPIIRNVLMPGSIKSTNLVMVTSALPGEGKTFTSLNLAISMATEIDRTVLLVDGDVAHPSIPSVLGAPHGPGLLDLLTRDDLDFGDALVKTNIEKLSLLPAGSRHRRSTELLASEQMGSLLREMAARYRDRIIIFDSPPLLPTTEARVLASNMGQIVMVVAADSTSQHAINQALATVEACEIVLMVLNKATRTDVGTYYGYYGNHEAN